MDNIKTEAAENHEQAAQLLENAAKMHREAAKQCLAGNYENAQSLAVRGSITGCQARGESRQGVIRTRTWRPHTRQESFYVRCRALPRPGVRHGHDRAR